LKYGKNDQRVTLEPLMRKHKTGSAKHGGIVQIAHQRFGGWRSGGNRSTKLSIHHKS